ncbi:uncharacterized protein LOC143280074 [Babylonia areolata]|uniref:uncharacterized protein LOC143280074 n=1 Tax=Babylonia areolata TaxID=304850 RepID=UPI003FD1E9D1
MRCIGSEGVHFSDLAHPPSPHPHSPHHLDDVTMASTTHDVTTASTIHDVTTASSSTTTPDVADPTLACDASPALNTHDLPETTSSSTSSCSSCSSSSSSSPPFVSVTKSDSDLTAAAASGEESPAASEKDLLPTTMSPGGLPPAARYLGPQPLSSVSSPELNTLAESSNSSSNSNSKRSSSGIVSSTSSFYVSLSGGGGSGGGLGDSESESSPTSTARNTLSNSSSLGTVSDFDGLSSSKATLSSVEVLTTSESELLETASSSAGKKPEARKTLTYYSSQIQTESSTVVPKRMGEASDAASSPTIQLPERYRHALRKGGSYGNVGSSSSSSSSCKKGGGGGDEEGQELRSREKDLGTALAWIRHEMMQMKEQDKVLLKRFIELRANILQLRCMYGSASDICSMDGSSVSLNEMRKPTSTSMRSADSDAMLSGGRMYAAPSSLSLPCSPQLSRLRWRSDELM